MTADSDQSLVLVIFGITGDLAQRKLLPALYRLAKDKQLPQNLRIVGITRKEIKAGKVYENQHQLVEDSDFDKSALVYLEDHTEIFTMDLADKKAYEDLGDYLAKLEATLGSKPTRLYYLSIPPQVLTPIIKLLSETGHNKPLRGSSDNLRILVEKPFGYDSASAKSLIDIMDESFDESQIYRIDHYVAKETVQNILTFRFENPIFEAVWSNKHVTAINIVAHEKIGINGRSVFYEQTGALRDLIQSHLLQLLAITTMDKPTKLESQEIHAEKLKLLKAIMPIRADEVDSRTKRGQYIGYREEINNDDSLTETYAQINLEIDNPTWRGVPVKLETGKALSRKTTEISVFFSKTVGKDEQHNCLLFRIQPDEGITLLLQVKRPGVGQYTEMAEMDFNYSSTFGLRQADAYERVLIDAIRGDKTLFATSEEVIASWEIIDSVISEWAKNDRSLRPYSQGCSPEAIDQIVIS